MPSPQTTFATPRATVIAFYKAHAEGREADAYALHSRLQNPSLTLDQYVRETRWRRDLELREVGPAEADRYAGRPEYYKGLHDLRQVRVEFYQAHDTAARKSGQATEWVAVARERPDGPWRIIEIGTGP
jgi:hypothetical protein